LAVAIGATRKSVSDVAAEFANLSRQSELAVAIGTTRKQVSDVAAELANLSRQSVELKSQLADLQAELARSRNEKRRLLELRRTLENEVRQLFFIVKELHKSDRIARTDLRGATLTTGSNSSNCGPTVENPANTSEI
jgi:chromosome segregation ATPase